MGVQLGDLLLRIFQLVFERLVAVFHALGGFRQALDDGAQARAVGRGADARGHVGKALAVLVRRAGGVIDHRHDFFDLFHERRGGIVDLVGLPHRRKILVVDPVDVGLRQLAAGLDDVVDQLIDGRVMTGRVVVPDFKIARIGGLLQGLDLVERNLRERITRCAILSVGFRRRPHARTGPYPEKSGASARRQP